MILLWPLQDLINNEVAMQFFFFVAAEKTIEIMLFFRLFLGHLLWGF